VGGGVEEGRGDFAGQAGVVAVHAGAGTGAGYNGAVANRFFQGLECFAGIEQVVGVAGEAPGFVPVVPLVRINDSKVGDAHVHHGPTDGANVAGALGFNEYDSDIFERIHDDWNVGLVEDWSDGLMECWINGKLECWKSGVLDWWKIGMLYNAGERIGVRVRFVGAAFTMFYDSSFHDSQFPIFLDPRPISDLSKLREEGTVQKSGTEYNETKKCPAVVNLRCVGNRLCFCGPS
jgi:hypothetical protein